MKPSLKAQLEYRRIMRDKNVVDVYKDAYAYLNLDYDVADSNVRLYGDAGMVQLFRNTTNKILRA